MGGSLLDADERFSSLSERCLGAQCMCVGEARGAIRGNIDLVGVNERGPVNGATV